MSTGQTGRDSAKRPTQSQRARAIARASHAEPTETMQSPEGLRHPCKRQRVPEVA